MIPKEDGEKIDSESYEKRKGKTRYLKLMKEKNKKDKMVDAKTTPHLMFFPLQVPLCIFWPSHLNISS